MKQIEQEVAEFLIDNNVMLSNFDKPRTKWVKRKYSIRTPVYYDCRSLLQNHANVEFIVQKFKELIKRDNFTDYTVFGVETAGVPFASILSYILKSPMGYIRTKYKEYGLTKLIEGNPPKGSKAIIVDENCFTGLTLIDSIEALKSECNISTIVLMTVIALSDYSCNNQWNYFKENDIPMLSLTNYKFLNKAALDRGLITEEQCKALNDFYKDPYRYKWKANR